MKKENLWALGPRKMYFASQVHVHYTENQLYCTFRSPIKMCFRTAEPYSQDWLWGNILPILPELCWLLVKYFHHEHMSFYNFPLKFQWHLSKHLFIDQELINAKKNKITLRMESEDFSSNYTHTHLCSNDCWLSNHPVQW